MIKHKNIQIVSLSKCQEASLGNLPGGGGRGGTPNYFLGAYMPPETPEFGPVLERICPTFDMVSQKKNTHNHARKLTMDNTKCNSFESYFFKAISPCLQKWRFCAFKILHPV